MNEWNGVKWEYKILTTEEGVSLPGLNEWGQDGWELVSILLDREFWLVFKRPDFSAIEAHHNELMELRA